MLEPKDCILAFKCTNTNCGFFFYQNIDTNTYYCPKCKYSTKPIHDYYRLFGLEKDFEISQLKERYKKLSLIHHPDTTNNNFNEDYLIIRKAYDTLKDLDEKNYYDYELRQFNESINDVDKTESPVEEKSSWNSWPSILLAIIFSSVIFILYKNFIYTGLTFFIMISLGMIWQEKFNQLISLCLEVLIILTLGYLFFLQKWLELAVVGLLFIGYFFIKKIYKKRNSINTNETNQESEKNNN